MATVLVDTSVWIHAINGRPHPAAGTLRDLIHREEDVAICGVVLAEVLQGIRDARHAGRIRELLGCFRYLGDRGKGSWLGASELYRTCRRSGITPRSLTDVLIAQIALERDAAVLHADRDFDAIAKVSALRIHAPGAT